MDTVEYIKKLELISEEKWQLENNAVDVYLTERKEFTRSLELFDQIDKSKLASRDEINKLIQLFIEIVSIEMLLRNNYGRAKGEFSTRGAWLLATCEEQLDTIQNHLGTLYTLRNFITHSLFLPVKSENFTRYFDASIDKALLNANSYHRLVLLRFIDKKRTILDKEILIKILLDAKLKWRLDIPESRYELLISKLLTETTKIKSKKRKEFSLNLPEEDDCFVWGINSYGGFVKPTHKITGIETQFYNDNVAIIPDIEIWNNFIKEVRNTIREIYLKDYKSVKVISKTHHSILFFLGYKFYKTDEVEISMDFEGDTIFIKPLKENIEFEDYWTLLVNHVKETDQEIIIILNVSGYVDKFLDNDIKRLGISKMPRLVLDYKCGKSKIKPNSLCFENGEEIKHACRSLDLFLAHNKDLRSIKRIHLFSESRGVMMFLLGIHMRLQKKDVILYELGYTEDDVIERHYYKVLECGYKK